MNNELLLFVKEALSHKIPRNEIRSALLKAFWQDDEIKPALEAYSEQDFPVLVPRHMPYLSAREAFVYLVTFFCLTIVTTTFGALLFDLVNYWVPDQLRPYESYISSTRWEIASVVIAFPLYLWLSSLILKSLRIRPEKRQTKVRKWLTYTTLFISAMTIIADLITLIFNYLNGELDTRVTLKILSVLLVAGVVFGFYLWDMRDESILQKGEGASNASTAKSERHARVFIGIVVAGVLAGVIAGTYIVGSPKNERQTQFDADRVNDLSQISSAIDAYFSRYRQLPPDLSALLVESYYINSIRDRQTQQEYEYGQTDAMTYSLCAVFDLASTPSGPNAVPEYRGSYPAKVPPPVGVYFEPTKRDWSHPAGRQCFELKVQEGIVKQCDVLNPCPSGQTCAELPDPKGTVCVPQGKECLAAACTAGCTLTEGYPVKVLCK